MKLKSFLPLRMNILQADVVPEVIPIDTHMYISQSAA